MDGREIDMNKHIELVKQWLADPESVSPSELNANYIAAAYAAAAADAADEMDSVEAATWVERYEELTQQKGD